MNWVGWLPKALGVKLKNKSLPKTCDLIERLLAGEGRSHCLQRRLHHQKEWKDGRHTAVRVTHPHQVIVQRTGGRVKPLKVASGTYPEKDNGRKPEVL